MFIDRIGCPISIGDIVFTSDFDNPGTVVKFTPKMVTIKEDDYMFNKYPSRVIVINEQINYIRKNYPENLI